MRTAMVFALLLVAAPAAAQTAADSAAVRATALDRPITTTPRSRAVSQEE